MKLNSNFSSDNLIKIKNLYLDAFPKSERKPFELILNKCVEGIMEIIAIEDENNKFLGLAITIIYKDMVLLDYFAITPEIRGKSVGSTALKMLYERYNNKRFILEIENTEIDCDNSDERIRRKAFYIKNGMIEMPFKVNLLGVEMEILTYNCEVSFDEYHNIYKNTFSDKFCNKIQIIK